MQRAAGTNAAAADAAAGTFVIPEITAALRTRADLQRPIDVDARREHG